MNAAWLVVALLSGWFAVTLAYQCFPTRMIPWMARYDRFRIIPAWRFFSTVARDFRVNHRRQLPNGLVTDWRLLPIPDGSWTSAVWNPWLKTADVILTAAEQLIELVEQASPPTDEAIRRAFAYRALIHIVQNAPGPHAAEAVQFRVVEQLVTDGVGGELDRFISRFESLLVGASPDASQVPAIDRNPEKDS